MKKYLLTIVAVFGIGAISLAASADKNLIELGKIYHTFKGDTTPSEEAYAKIKEIMSTELKPVASFVREVISPDNKLMSTEYLRLPDAEVLKQVFTIQQVNWNMMRAKPRANADVLVELSLKRIGHNDMVDAYYEMLFSSVITEYQALDLSTANLVLNNYNLRTDIEKAVFYFKVMDHCGKRLLMEASKTDPTDQAMALGQFAKFPQFNGLPYYQYTDFGFEPFKLKISPDRAEENYTLFYLNRFYDMLLWHAECLNSKKKYKEQREHLIKNSLLYNEQYFRFSSNRNMVEALAQSVEE